jgi:hypothetical protein
MSKSTTFEDLLGKGHEIRDKGELMSKIKAGHEYRAIEDAYVMLLNGDHILANYSVRDLELTREAGMRDLAWLYDREGVVVSRREVRALLDEVSEYMLGPELKHVNELMGLSRRAQVIEEMLVEALEIEIRDRIQEETVRIQNRIDQIVPD